MKTKARPITITISHEFLKNLEEVAYLFVDEDKDLGHTIETHASWVFKNLCEFPSTAELENLLLEARWDTEEECRTAAERLSPKLEPTVSFEVSGRTNSWRIHLFDSRHPQHHALWKYCQSEGLDFVEEVERREKFEHEQWQKHLAKLRRRRR